MRRRLLVVWDASPVLAQDLPPGLPLPVDQSGVLQQRRLPCVQSNVQAWRWEVSSNALLCVVASKVGFVRQRLHQLPPQHIAALASAPGPVQLPASSQLLGCFEILCEERWGILVPAFLCRPLPTLAHIHTQHKIHLLSCISDITSEERQNVQLIKISLVRPRLTAHATFLLFPMCSANFGMRGTGR